MLRHHLTRLNEFDRSSYALQPTVAPISVREAPGVRERTVRSTVALGRLWLSLPRRLLNHFPRDHEIQEMNVLKSLAYSSCH